MSNKENFKKMFDNHSNKEKNYQKIVERIEERKKMNKVYKYAFVPALLLILVIGGVFMLQNNSSNLLNGKPNEEQKESTVNDKIVINSKSNSDISSGSVKFDAKLEDINLDDITNKFNLKNIVIPNEYKYSNSYVLYIRGDRETKYYNILHDYVINYETADGYHISIAISEVSSPMRDYRFDSTNDKESTINGTKLFITKYSNSYIVTFTKNNTYYDIETMGISEEELINLLKSMI